MHRIGLIGCGWFAAFHLKAFQSQSHRTNIVWVADAVMESAQRVAHTVGARAIADYREGLSEVDAVVILLPHHLHRDVAVECLRAGKHVLLEKPMSITLAEADDMIAAAEASRRTLMIAYPHRYRRSMQTFKQLVTHEQHGPLVMLDGFMDESLQGYSLGWLSKRSTLGGGVYFSSSPHMLDVMLWIAGPVRHVSMVGTRGRLPMEGEDTAACVIKFESDVIGVTRHTWMSPKSTIWYTMRAMCRDAWITLTTTPVGDLIKDGPTCPWRTRIEVLSAEGSTTVLDSDEGLDLEPEVAHFLDCVETGATPQTSGQVGRQLIELVQTAYRQASQVGANVP
ncbi:MAG: Gfo/Idh/MocA family oxidoreductase [Phycisphaeraceae bacterium]|nr:Gfo/Idh/MocA family oxidoreductase [Phycisphaeraceae bacterium]